MKTGRGWTREDAKSLSYFVCEDRNSAGVYFNGLDEKVVKVRILKESDYRKLVKNQKAEK